MNKLSKNLKKFLQNEKISENELARRTGISQQIINRILSGENKNPKIATLNALTTYFKISISELIGDEVSVDEQKFSEFLIGWSEIPTIKWDLIKQYPITELILQSHEKLLIDIQSANNLFASKLQDSTMEPKFSKGTLMIFDISRKFTDHDFILLVHKEFGAILRQVFIGDNNTFIKSLNPTSEDYNLVLLSNEYYYIGKLIQSRTDYFNP